MSLLPLLYRSSTTTTVDTPFKLVNKDMWFESIDVFIYDHSAYMGDLQDQDVLITANDIYYILHPVNLHDYYFKNASAGDNTRIVVAGILLSDTRKRELNIPVV